MAGTAVVRRVTAPPGTDLRAVTASLNKVITDLELLRAAFMAHTHKTPTTNPGFTSTPNTDAGGSGSTGGTASTAVGTAAALTAFLVKDANGTTIADDAR